jgi:MFS family permease
MTSRAIVALGIGQCVNWGVLYYAFGVLLIPLEHDLAVPRWVLAGAFSLALLISAAIAPAVGRWSDRGHGLFLIRGGGFAAAALLGAWIFLPGVAALYLVWSALGLCIAATLYEPVFVVVGHALTCPGDRLRALATVTVFGGLASTVFLPLTALLAESWGWRGAVGVLACALAVSTYFTTRIALGSSRSSGPAPLPVPSTADVPALDPRFRQVLALFSAASLASAAFATTVVPALVDRHLPPTTAALLGGVLGVMQLPGRALLMNRTLTTSPSRLLVVSLSLQAAGLAALVAAQSPAPVGAGIGLFAVGAGLMTLVRPHLVQTVFAIERAGYLNGRLAQSQQFARAAGPVLAVAVASAVGYGPMFAMLAGVMAVLAVTSNVLVEVQEP